MNALIEYSIDDQSLILSPQKAIYWQQQKTLIVADVHIGKTGHFRKAGIPVPARVYKADLHRLFSLILFFKAEKLLIVGDFTHSTSNLELDLFQRWRRDMSALNIELVKGNHDILHQRWYDDTGINCTGPRHQLGNFLFVHDVADCKEPVPEYIFGGHIHPGVRMRGMGKQSMVFPCFYFTDTYSILPAFGGFTGVSVIAPSQTDNVFAIVENDLMQLQ
ncbi:MAG: ligase-associated DNA damage response endonuclease PdeM [Chitinophagaceae bacterium]|nr:MAG: ligase-associated DNA damage response endonuclease PdeM [Chitinophagaceae bacterium]